MRILIVDSQGLALDWALRCRWTGHEVKWFVRDTEKTRAIGKGLVDRVDAWQDWMRWADLVFITDNTRYLREMDAWRARGCRIFGPSSDAAQLELDRDCGQKAFKKAGVATLPGVTFNDYDSAIRYVKKEDRRFVSKPSGDADKALSYVSKTPADMVFMLERWKKAGKLKSPFILQDFVPGIEMAVGGWFGPGGFNIGWCENFEFKKLMNDDLGVNTGEQGTVLRYVKKSKLADRVLRPMEAQLERLNYIGYVDVNCIIDDTGTPWPLEFTCRPGWPTFNIQQALIEHEDHAEWMVKLHDGEDARPFTLERVALGVVLSIPDYPYSHLTRKEVLGIPLYGMTSSIRPSIHPCEMMLGEAPFDSATGIVTKPCMVTAGDYVLVTTGTGDTILQAKKRSYSILENLTMPNSPMWRTDIGDRLKSQLPKLQAKGYAKGLTWTTAPNSPASSEKPSTN